MQPKPQGRVKSLWSSEFICFMNNWIVCMYVCTLATKLYCSIKIWWYIYGYVFKIHKKNYPHNFWSIQFQLVLLQKYHYTGFILVST